MFGGLFGRKNKEENTIKITVTRTSSQAQYERKIRDEAEKQSRICPECGYIDNNNDIPNFGYRSGDGSQGYFGECKVCGTKWDVNYRL
jgi:DNA-directed RNA polymerase subunit M/transcription elongation factor TFIIS